jgi:hypothetical protein
MLDLLGKNVRDRTSLATLEMFDHVVKTALRRDGLDHVAAIVG